MLFVFNKVKKSQANFSAQDYYINVRYSQIATSLISLYRRERHGF